MKVRDILETKGDAAVFTISAVATIMDLAEHLCELRCGALLISDDDGTLAGIVSERDVIRHVAAREDLDRVTVGDIMTRQLVSVGPDEDINGVMDLMVTNRIRHLPVVSADGPCGVVTVRDLIYAMREADRHDVDALEAYLQSELEARQVVHDGR